jgi:3'(2'), 5'-bisphosphate nucleotidase
VDPLDGTKDFIAANDEFTVNIALIENGVPVLGLIYAPALDEIYFAKKGDGALLIKDGLETKLPNKQCSGIIAGRSRFHDSDSFDEFLKINKIESSIAFGSALKFGKLAMGAINIYPRFVGSSEWDIAAGHLIVKEAGCDIIDLETFREPVYNKTSIRNNNFIAHNKKLNFSDFNLPKDVK